MKPLQLTTLCLFLLFLLNQQVTCQDAEADGEGEPEEEQPVPHLEITSIIAEPWLIVKNANATGNARFEGYIVDLLAEVADILEFTYTIRIVIDGKYGTRKGDGSWTGLIGELIAGDADLAAADLTITTARQQVVAFSQPFMNISLGVVVPDGSGITSLKDLVDDKDMQYGTIDGGSTMEAFRSTQDNLFITMWSHIGGEDSYNVASYKEGIQKVQSEGKNYSFILEGPMADYYGSSKCGITALKEKFLQRSGYGLAMLPDAEFDGIAMDDINNALQSMQEEGIMDSLYEEWFISDTCAGSRILISSFLLLFCLMFYLL